MKTLRAGSAGAADLESVDLLVVGSPTQGGRPMPAVRGFLDQVPHPVAKGLKVATFDTRLSTKLVGIFGYAAGRRAGARGRLGGGAIG